MENPQIHKDTVYRNPDIRPLRRSLMLSKEDNSGMCIGPNQSQVVAVVALGASGVSFALLQKYDMLSTLGNFTDDATDLIISVILKPFRNWTTA